MPVEWNLDLAIKTSQIFLAWSLKRIRVADAELFLKISSLIFKYGFVTFYCVVFWFCFFYFCFSSHFEKTKPTSSPQKKKSQQNLKTAKHKSRLYLKPYKTVEKTLDLQKILRNKNVQEEICMLLFIHYLLLKYNV